MKSKTLVLACVLSAATFSFSAFAEESSVCADPLKKICQDTLVERAQRNVYINKLKGEISAEANAKAAPRIEEMKKKISKLHFIKRAIQTFKIRNQEIMNAAKKRITGIESVVTNQENINLLKSYMNQAIDESNFDSATKANFRSVIQSIIIGNFADFLERTGMEDNFLAQLLSNACGSDGMVANAFATTLNNEKYVLICPGFLITLTQTADLRERFDTILQAISHEMGHHIDNGAVGDELYKPFLGCLADNYSDKFNKTKDDEKFCKKNEKDPSACNMKVTTSHGGELVADAWGIKVLSIHARKQNYSFAETDQLLTRSWAGLCNTGDEGIHPSGDFRIGTLLRTNPDISDYLACGNAGVNNRPACTFDGEVNI